MVAESNGFICDEANRALQAMIRGVSETRATLALVSCSAHRNPSCRAKAALHLSRAFEQMGYTRVLQSREIKRIVPILATLLSEGAPRCLYLSFALPCHCTPPFPGACP